MAASSPSPDERTRRPANPDRQGAGLLALSHPNRQAAGRPASITGTDDDDDFDAAYNGSAGAWDARVDLDLSGTLTSADDTLFTAEFVAGEAGGYRVLSRASLANRLGYAGYQHAPELAKTKWHVQHRVRKLQLPRHGRRLLLAMPSLPKREVHCGSRMRSSRCRTTCRRKNRISGLQSRRERFVRIQRMGICMPEGFDMYGRRLHENTRRRQYRTLPVNVKERARRNRINEPWVWRK